MTLLFKFALLAALSICPKPAEQKISETIYHPMESVSISCRDGSAVQWAERHLCEWYGEFAPKVSRGRLRSLPVGKEEYVLKVGKAGISVEASTLQGVRYALYSLRQIAIPRRGTMTVAGWIAPECEVRDKPALGFRGIHICWFHENESWEIERMIRLAAYYKLNYAVIEPWGSYRSETAPWLCWPDSGMTKEEIRRLRGIADDLGITLIPQFNMFGHATQARVRSGKHSTLDLDPRYQPLFEPEGGWNWCLSNPETRKVLLAVMNELLEDFGNPPYFHIGFDEAEAPSCPECLGRPYDELFGNHIKVITDALLSRGVTPMMWHDMLLERGDQRWKGFKAGGCPATVKVGQSLPKDVIICDWYYKGPVADYPTLRYFKELGHPVLACPWDNVGGMKALAGAVAQYGLDGMLGTLWHHFYGRSMENIFTFLAHYAWNPASDAGVARLVFATHLRQIGWDMKTTDPRRTGNAHHDITAQPAY